MSYENNLKIQQEKYLERTRKQKRSNHRLFEIQQISSKAVTATAKLMTIEFFLPFIRQKSKT